MRRIRDVCLLGLVLGLSGCAGMQQQRLASHPKDAEGAASRTLASRGGRLRHQAAESPGRTPREPSATKTAANTARPLTNRPPEAVSRYFPGMNRRGDGAAGIPDPEPARPDPLGIRPLASRDAVKRSIPEEGRTRSGGEPPSSLPAVLNVSVHPDDPSSLYPDAINAVKPAGGRPDAVQRPRDEPAPATRAVTLPEPVEAPATQSDPVPKPAGSAAVDPAPAEGSTPHEATVVATSASTAPELSGLTLDQEPVVPTPDEANESVPIPVPGPDLPPVRGELPQARVIDKNFDVDNDPILAGRPRLRLVRPGVEARHDGGAERPPDDAFPASYHAYPVKAVDPETRPALATATVVSAARPRRTLLARLFRRSGEPRTGTPAASSARPESRNLAHRGDIVDRVAARRLHESSER